MSWGKIRIIHGMSLYLSSLLHLNLKTKVWTHPRQAWEHEGISLPVSKSSYTEYDYVIKGLTSETERVEGMYIKRLRFLARN